MWLDENKISKVMNGYSLEPYYYSNLDVSGIKLIKEGGIVYMEGYVKTRNKQDKNDTLFYPKVPKEDNFDLFELCRFDLRPFCGEDIKVYAPPQDSQIIVDFMKKVFGYTRRKYVYDCEIWDKIKELGFIDIDYVDFVQNIKICEKYCSRDYNYHFIHGDILVKRSNNSSEFYIINIKHFLNMDFSLLSDEQMDHLNRRYLYNPHYNIFNKRISNKINKHGKIEEIDKLKILNNFLNYKINASSKHKKYVRIHL